SRLSFLFFLFISFFSFLVCPFLVLSLVLYFSCTPLRVPGALCKYRSTYRSPHSAPICDLLYTIILASYLQISRSLFEYIFGVFSPWNGVCYGS
ncbi:hypothetical protein ASPWEDRAFT_126876, partial [Aspergillus wentii DTO 134E9]